HARNRETKASPFPYVRYGTVPFHLRIKPIESRGRRQTMKQHIAIAATAFFLSTAPALSGEAEIRAAQSSIEAQIRAFLAGENETAYSYAAPSIRRIFPTVEQFMAMVKNGYQPVWKPRDFAFGDAKE